VWYWLSLSNWLLIPAINWEKSTGARSSNCSRCFALKPAIASSGARLIGPNSISVLAIVADETKKRHNSRIKGIGTSVLIFRSFSFINSAVMPLVE